MQIDKVNAINKNLKKKKKDIINGLYNLTLAFAFKHTYRVSI